MNPKNILFLSIIILSLCAIGSAHAMNPLGAVLVPNSGSNTVSIIDTSTNTVTATIYNTGLTPRVAIINPGGNKLYVGCYDGREVDVVDLVNLQITDRIATPANVMDLAISNDGGYVYAGLYNDQVLKINTVTNSIESSTTVGTGYITSMQISGDGSELWVAMSDPAVYVLNTNGGGALSLAHTVSGFPATVNAITYVVGQSGNPNYVYATVSSMQNKIYKISTSTYAITTTVTSAAVNPYFLSYGSNQLYVSSYSSGVVVMRYDANLNFQGNVSVYMPAGVIIPSWGTTAYVGTQTSGIMPISTLNNSPSGANVSVGATPFRLTYGQLSQEASITYAPQLVNFQVNTLLGTTQIDNMNITVSDSNGLLLLSSITDSSGSAAFILLPTKPYVIRVFGLSPFGSTIDHTFNITPSQNNYQLNIPFEEILGFQSTATKFLNTEDQGKISYYTTGSLNTSTNIGSFQTFYEDTGLHTSAVNVSLYRNNSTIGGSPVLLSSQTYQLADTGNLLSNSGFESSAGLDANYVNGNPWIHLGDFTANSQLVTGSAHSGNNNGRINISGQGSGNYAGILYGDGGSHGSFSVVSNKTYTYDIWIKTPTLTNSYLSVDMNYLDAGYGFLGGVHGTSISTQHADWTHVTGQFPVISNANARYGYLYVSGMKTSYPFSFDISLDDALITSYSINNTFTASNAAGNSYYIQITATQTDGTTKTYYMPIAFAGPTVTIPGFPLEWYWWMAFIPALFLFAVGTATKKGMAGMIGMIWAYIANYWNWFSLYVPQWAMYIIITIGVMISLGVIILESERFRS